MTTDQGPTVRPDLTPFMQALLEATQKELAWRQAWSAAVGELVDGKTKVDLKQMKAAEQAYLKAAVHLHQVAKRWAAGE